VQEHHGGEVGDDVGDGVGGFGGEEGDYTECGEGLEVLVSFAGWLLAILCVCGVEGERTIRKGGQFSLLQCRGCRA
jgi:hypothetical protein